MYFMYFAFIGIAVALIIFGNLLFNAALFDYNTLYIVTAAILSTIAVIGVDAVVASIIRWLTPKRWYEPDRKLFKVSKKEQHFYEKLGIKKWKDRVFEFGHLTGFRKNKIADPNSVEYLERFLVESNYGFVIHIFCCIFGFAIIFFYPLQIALFVGVPVAIVNIIYNLLSVFILRYNTPKLQILRKYAKRKQAQEEQKEQEDEEDMLVAQA